MWCRKASGHHSRNSSQLPMLLLLQVPGGATPPSGSESAGSRDGSFRDGSCRSNCAIRSRGAITPPTDSGLRNGSFRNASCRSTDRSFLTGERFQMRRQQQWSQWSQWSQMRRQRGQPQSVDATDKAAGYLRKCSRSVIVLCVIDDETTVCVMLAP
jgi:hypothetical protein